MFVFEILVLSLFCIFFIVYFKKLFILKGLILFGMVEILVFLFFNIKIIEKAFMELFSMNVLKVLLNFVEFDVKSLIKFYVVFFVLLI